MDRTAFRKAVEAHNLEDMMALFAEDAVLHSPITFQPFEGREAIARLLGIILEVFEGFHYTDQLEGADGTLGLVFRTRVLNRDVQGLDLIHFNPQGQIQELTVMVRPRSALETLLAEVAPRLAAASARAS